MTDYPQVVLFGTIPGGWREKYIIPVLDELGVSYYNPVAPDDGWWTKDLGDKEVEVMANCETIIMVFNKYSPSFTGLAEAGWAALGAYQRGQNFIMQVDLEYKVMFPPALREIAEGRNLNKRLQHWVTSGRHLVHHHAKSFEIETMHIVDDIPAVITCLRGIYSR